MRAVCPWPRRPIRPPTWRQGRIDRQSLVALRHPADGRKAVDRVEVDFAQAGRHRHVGNKAQQQGVAVWLGRRGQHGAQIAARSGLVVNNHLPAQRAGEPLPHQPPQRVIAAARWAGPDELYEMVGAGLGVQQQRRGGSGQG